MTGTRRPESVCDAGIGGSNLGGFSRSHDPEQPPAEKTPEDAIGVAPYGFVDNIRTAMWAAKAIRRVHAEGVSEACAVLSHPNTVLVLLGERVVAVNMPKDHLNRPPNVEGVVRLTHKYSERIDGIDLRAHEVGDTFALGDGEARLLIAEGWAERLAERRGVTTRDVRAMAADTNRRDKRRSDDSG